MLEIFEQSASGLVLEYDPKTKQVRVVADGCCGPGHGWRVIGCDRCQIPHLLSYRNLTGKVGRRIFQEQYLSSVS